MESSGNGSLQSAERIILRCDSTASEDARDQMIFDSDRHEIDSYLTAVEEIQRSVESMTTAADQKKASTAIQIIAMARLKDEFRNLLIFHTGPVESSSSRCFSDSDSLESSLSSFDDSHGFSTRYNSEDDLSCWEIDGVLRVEDGEGEDSSTPRLSTNSIKEIDLIPPEPKSDLRTIAERMISAGYTCDCVQVYVSVRKSAIDASFMHLGVEKLSIGDIQLLEWNILEDKIRRWIPAAKTCVRILFASEKSLCQQIFENLGTSIDEECFVETVKGPAIQLFNFADAISTSRRSPEKLFRILDLHDALSNLLPDIETVFESGLAESIRVQAAEIISRLAEAARGILSDVENMVLRESTKLPVPGGTVHPLTRYVMNYIRLLILDYKQTMLELIVDKPSTGSRYSGDPMIPDMDFAKLEGRSPLSLHLIWIIVILQFNLDGKGKLYQDDSTAHLFMMNNVHYIFQKIKDTPDLRELIGDQFLNKLRGRFRQAAASYQRSTWARVLHCLREEGLYVSGRVSKTALRERFKAFNSSFDEVHRTQATWLIPDSQLREELRISVSEKLIPAYRSFLGRFTSHIESRKHPETYIKYSVEDLEIVLLDLFEGIPVAPRSSRITIPSSASYKPISLGLDSHSHFPAGDNKKISTPDPKSRGEEDYVVHIGNRNISDCSGSITTHGCQSTSGTALVESNCDPMEVPPTISHHFSILQELDLSYVEINSLPQSISRLVALRKLFLRGCELLMELPPELGELVNLEVLDLEGTEILCLPKELAKLVNLMCLKVSFYGYANQIVIPRGVLSNLSRLKELIIDVTPYGDWWDVEVETTIDDLCSLKELRALKFYFPAAELLEKLTLIFPCLTNFRFTVGRHEEHFVSRLPLDVDEEFNDWDKLDKGLKCINESHIREEITEVLKHANAFFLQRHWTAKGLSEFGHENITEVKYCLVMECNEFRTIIDTEQFYQGKDGMNQSEDSQDFDDAIVFASLEKLIIRYMRNMESVWKGPVGKGSLSNLKSLAFHTCPKLTILFTVDMFRNLSNLEELIVEDCPKIDSLVSLKSSDSKSGLFLPNLKKISLLELPELVSISSGLCIAPNLERMVVFYCPKLEKLSTADVSSTKLKVIKGEREWWDALKWYESDLSTEHEDFLGHIFIPLRMEGDLTAQLTKD